MSVERIALLESDLKLSQKENSLLSSKVERLTTGADSTNTQISGNEVAEIEAKNNIRIEELKAINQKLISQVLKIEKRKNEYKAEYNKLVIQSKTSLEKLKSLDQKLKLVQKDQELEESGARAELEKLKDEVENYSSKLEIEQEKTVQLKVDLAKLRDIEKPLELSLAKTNEHEEELSRLIGDSFEVENQAVWTIQDNEGQKSGPHSFSKVYDMKEAGEFGEDFRFKKEGEAFKPRGDIFELCVPVTTHGEGESRRFFVKRNSVRVPFYELITFEMGGEEFRGYCTSLSSGGVFIELNNVDESLLKMNDKGRVLFPSGALANPFNCVAQIKNISTNKPKGIGLMFVDLSDNAREDVLTYVNNFLNKSKAAA